MTTLRINFAPRTFKRMLYRARPLAWAIAFLGMMLCTGAALIVSRLNGGQAITEHAIDLLQAQLNERHTHEAAHVSIPENQAEDVNRAIMQLNIPWRDLLDAIETATPGTIALLALEPDAKKHRVKGMAEAKSSDTMVAYIEALKHQGFFDEVVLTKHEINDQDPNRPLRFRFEAQWREGGR